MELLGGRAALRGERAAELMEAEALARARVLEMDGPLMRSDLQDKARHCTCHKSHGRHHVCIA